MKRPADDDDSAYPKLSNRLKQPTSPSNINPALNNADNSVSNGDISSSTPNHLNNGSPSEDQNLNIALASPNALQSLMDDKVAILDCGAQYGKVIDRRIRELCVESEIMPLDTTLETILERKYRAIVISGGPKSVYSNDASKCDHRIFNSKIPILGICYGLQLINKEFGGHVERNTGRIDGQYDVKIDVNCPIFKGLRETEKVLLTHGDVVKVLAPGFKPIAHANGYIAGIASEHQKIFGVQFHPEVDLTPSGQDIFRNFLFNIAGCRGQFTMKTREHQCIDEIRKVVKDKKVLLLCSGGVDSTVCAVLLKKALGPDRVFAVHIDNGFMRKKESAQVQKSLEALGVILRVYTKARVFYNGSTRLTNRSTGEIIQIGPLNRTVQPEYKRRIIGDTFIKVTEQVLAELKLNFDEVFLAQGTLRPDLIESASHLASGAADAIKTHHNDTEMVRALRTKGRVIEPLKDFHKDEVRKLGLDLGLPEHVVMRHPFPGPGLAIRILCNLHPHMARDFKETEFQLSRIIELFHHFKTGENDLGDARYENAEKKTTQEMAAYECFCSQLSRDDQENLRYWQSEYHIRYCLLPILSVGVQGDSRTYSYVVALSTETRPVPWPVLMHLSRLIPKIFENVNRVVYVFGPPIKDSAISDITPTLLTSTPIKLAQEADDVATNVLAQSGYVKSISQMPIILVPLHFDRPKPGLDYPSLMWSVVIRTFITNDFMTGIPAEPGKDIPEKVIIDMANALKEVPLISRVMYDLTAKPPGTTEWE